MSPGSARLFVAIPLPAETRQSLESLCQGSPEARWTDVEDFHLTLRFLGEVTREQEQNLCDNLGRMRQQGFRMRLRGIGHFPLRGDVRTLWAGVEENAELTRLARKVENACRQSGFKPEARKFHPHVTLARFSATGAASAGVRAYEAANGLFSQSGIPVTSFALFHSRMGSEGPRYDLLEEWELDPFDEDA